MTINKQRTNYISWDTYFMSITKLSAMRSKDPKTQVGACIVSNDNRILSIGYNGAPNGFCDDIFPWDREGKPQDTKYLFVCHAELNAILNFRGSKIDNKYKDTDSCIASRHLFDTCGVTYREFNKDVDEITIDLTK